MAMMNLFNGVMSWLGQKWNNMSINDDDEETNINDNNDKFPTVGVTNESRLTCCLFDASTNQVIRHLEKPSWSDSVDYLNPVTLDSDGNEHHSTLTLKEVRPDLRIKVYHLPNATEPIHHPDTNQPLVFGPPTTHNEMFIIPEGSYTNHFLDPNNHKNNFSIKKNANNNKKELSEKNIPQLRMVSQQTPGKHPYPETFRRHNNSNNNVVQPQPIRHHLNFGTTRTTVNHTDPSASNYVDPNNTEHDVRGRDGLLIDEDIDAWEDEE